MHFSNQMPASRSLHKLEGSLAAISGRELLVKGFQLGKLRFVFVSVECTGMFIPAVCKDLLPEFVQNLLKIILERHKV